MLKWYIYGIDFWIGPKRYNVNYLSGNIVNALLEWIENNSHVTPYTNVSGSVVVNDNVNILRKNKQPLKISVHELQNDLVLPVAQCGLYGARNENIKVFIGDT